MAHLWTDKSFIAKWENFRANLVRSTPVPQMTDAEKIDFKKKLESKPEEWFQFMFPNYYTASPARFHIQATNRLLKHDRWYEVRKWARELSKSTRGMMEDLYLGMTCKAKTFLLVSHNWDNASELLMPYLINLESNHRLLWLYGQQSGLRNWEIGKFVTRGGVSFRALGAGQSPRGARNEERRPDVIRVDDIDTDERCRSEKRIKETWEWVEQALIPTVSVSGNVRIIFQGNLIAKNSIIAKACEMADYISQVNIRDKNGKSTWPSKNTEKHIDWLLSKISYISQQKEYFNNPIITGTVFNEVSFKKIERLERYKFLIAYGDPSFKDSRKNDFKAVVLLGKYKSEYHIIKAFMGQTTTAAMAEFYNEIYNYVNGRVPVYYYIEANATQDIIFEQIKKHIVEQGWNFSIVGDYRKKGDKFSRIESALEPINRNGQLYFNLAEEKNPHMQILKDQFLALDPSLSGHDDGPDAVEGAKYKLDRKIIASGGITIGKRGVGNFKNKNRY
jgi:phage terminase large subunit-like protein